MVITRFRLPLGTIAFTATIVSSLAAQQPDYAKAERMLTWNTGPLLANDILSVTWLSDSTRFWYRVSRRPVTSSCSSIRSRTRSDRSSI